MHVLVMSCHQSPGPQTADVTGLLEWDKAWGKTSQKMPFAEYFCPTLPALQAYMVTYFGHFYMFPQRPILYFPLHTLEGRYFRDDCN